MVTRTRTIDFLPEIFQTRTNQLFLNATLDQLVQQPDFKKVQGFIGSKFGYGVKSTDTYLVEPDSVRNNYQLEPSVVFQKTGTSQAIDLITYPGIIDALRTESGINVSDNKLFNNQFYSWDSFVDLDKIINYGQYYWIPTGPESVNITTEKLLLDSTYTIINNPNTYDFSINGATPIVGNPEITLVRGGTYTFLVNQDTPFYIQTMPGISGVDPTKTNVSTREIYGVTNNGVPNSVMTFTVPMADAEDGYRYPVGITIDVVTTLDFNQVNGQYVFAIDGVTDLENKLLMFYGQDPNATSSVDGSILNQNLYRINYVPTSDPLQFLIQLTAYTSIPTEIRIDANSGKQFIGKSFVKNAVGEIILLPQITSNLNTLYYVDGTNDKKYGIIKLVDDVFSSVLNVNDILGSTNYVSPNGITFSNGLRVTFTGSVYPENYLNDSYYVEGVGTSINLIPSSQQIVTEPFGQYIDQPFDEAYFGTTPFDNSKDLPNVQDYITINRNSRDKNAWSRSNCWFHVDVLKTIANNNNISPIASAALASTTNRAKRPIIEFYPNLRLFDHGINGKDTIDYFDNITPNALSTIAGGSLNVYYPDGPTSALFDGARVVFAADNDINVRNKIYTCHVATINNKQIITLSVAFDGNIEYLDNVHVSRGESNAGYSFYFDGNQWLNCQEKQTVNQSPLFDLFDKNGNSLSDQEYYPGSDFKGCTLFEYLLGSNPLDPVLNLPISYSGVGNLNDIVFQTSLNANTFNYVINNTSYNEQVNIGYVHSYDKNNQLVRKIGWNTAVERSFQYQIFNFVYNSVTMPNGPIFVADVMIKDSMSTMWPTIVVYVDNSVVDSTNYTVTNTNDTTSITITSSISDGTHVDIMLYSDQTSNIGYYDIPTNLDHNPFNETITTLTSGDIRGHYKSICNNLAGNLIGTSFGANNYRDLGDVTGYGTRIIQNSSSLPIAAAFIRKQSANFFNGLIYNSNEYVKFKSTLVYTVDQQNYTPYDSAAYMLDDTLSIMVGVKSPDNSFFWSDMIPNQNPTISNSYAFRIGLSKALFPLSRVYDFTVANYYGVLAYVNRTVDGLPVQLQLAKDIDYVIVDNYLEIIVPLNDGDVITVNEYDQTYGSYIPNTPTKLGFYPKYVPTVILDDTYSTPTYFIIGHDGSYTKLYGEYNNGLLQDFRDKVLYEFELRVYNNMKVNTTFAIQPNDIRPGFFRDTGYSYDEYMSIYTTNFLNWVGLNRINYTNQFYDSTDDYTYNYNTAISSLSNTTFNSGNWRGIFLNLYDTCNPHDRPWEMLGFVIEPSWWQTRYGAAPYTSDNLLLWTDLSNGFIYNNGNSYIDKNYVRDGLLKIIPVDENGNLLSPFRIKGLIKRYKITDFKNNWSVGDVGPAEYSYIKSSSYPFDLMRIYALLKPSDFFCLGLDLDGYRYNTEFNQFLTDDRYRTSLTNINVYGNGQGLARSLQDQYAKHSYLNWLVDYLNQYGVGSSETIANTLASLDVRLAYRMAGFSDQNQLQFLIEKGSPNSTSNSLLIPDDSYSILLYQNEPNDIIVYSSVIVQKTLTGYKVFGNSQNKAYFLSYAPYYNNLVNPITVANTTVNIPITYTTTVITTPYGTEFSSVQLLCEFLKGYGNYLESQGMQFNDIENNVAITWDQMIAEILYWYNSGWEVGSTINVNPNANTLTIDTGSTVVQPLTDYTHNFVLNQNLVQFPLESLAITRIDTQFTVKSLSQADAISYFKSTLSSVEHAVVFNNVTVFNDVVFNLLTGLRQQRLYLRGTKSNNWNGTLYAPGFIINQSNVEPWTPNTQYYKGDTVLYKNSYYMANIPVIIPSDVFTASNWIKTQYQNIHKGLIANPNTRASESQLYYDTHSSNLQNDADLLGYSLIGYRPRSYLSDINLTDPSQVNLYQSMIALKGTENALNILQSIDLNAIQFNYSMYENWLVQKSEYGGILNQNFIEFTLDGGMLTGNPAIVSVIVDKPVSASQQEVPLYSLTNYGRLLDNTNILPLKTTQNTKGLPSAGYANLNDTTYYSYNLNQLPNSTIYNLYGDDYIYLADSNGDWGMYCAIPIKDVRVTHVINNLNGTVTITFTKSPLLNVGDMIGILNFDTRVDGYYTIDVVVNNTTYIITLTLSNNVTQVTSGTASFVFNLESVRLSSPIGLLNLSLPYEYSNNLVWVDSDKNNNWAVLEKSLNYTKQNFLGSISGNETYGDSVNYVPGVGYVVGDSTLGNVYTYAKTDNGYILRNTISHTPPFGKTIARNDEFLLVSSPDSSLTYIYIYRIVQSPEIEALVPEQILSFALDTPVGNTMTVSGDGQLLFLSIDGYRTNSLSDTWVIPPTVLVYKRNPSYTYQHIKSTQEITINGTPVYELMRLSEATLPDKKYFKVMGDQTVNGDIHTGARVTFYQYTQFGTSSIYSFGYIPQAYTKPAVVVTGGSGTSASFDVTLNQTRYTAAIHAAGTGYTVNDILTIPYTILDGLSTTNNLVIKVVTVSSTGQITSASIVSGVANGYNLNTDPADSQSVLFKATGFPNSSNNYLQQYRKYYLKLTGTIPVGTVISFDPTADIVDYTLTANNTYYGTLLTGITATNKVSTSGTGTVKFDVDVNGATYLNATPSLGYLGTGYAVNDTLTILGSSLGGVDTTNDLVLQVTAIGTSGSIAQVEIVSGTAVSSEYTTLYLDNSNLQATLFAETFIALDYGPSHVSSYILSDTSNAVYVYKNMLPNYVTIITSKYDIISDVTTYFTVEYIGYSVTGVNTYVRSVNNQFSLVGNLNNAISQDPATGLYSLGQVPTNSFGSSIANSYNGDKLFIGSPTSNFNDAIANVGYVYIYTRLSETWEVQYDVASTDFYTLILPWVPDPSSSVYINGAMLETNQYVVLNLLSQGCFLLIGPRVHAGDIITLSSPNFVLDARIASYDSLAQLHQGQKFGSSLACNISGSELLVGTPYDVTVKGQEGAVYRYTNEGKKFGTITALIAANNQLGATYILLNGYRVTIPASADAYDVANAINEFAVPNIIAYVYDAPTGENLLRIRLLNQDLISGDNKLNIAVFNGNFLYELGISSYIKTQTIREPHPQNSSRFGLKLAFNEASSFVVTAPRATRYLNTVFDLIDANNSHNNTVFDNNLTIFEDSFSNAGAAYVYDYVTPYKETLLNTGQFIFGQAVNDTIIDYGPTPEYGLSVAFSNNIIMVGSPNFKSNTQIQTLTFMGDGTTKRFGPLADGITIFQLLVKVDGLPLKAITDTMYYNGDGVRTIFPIPGQLQPSDLLVTVNNAQKVPYTDYITSGNNLTFTTVPGSGSVVAITGLSSNTFRLDSNMSGGLHILFYSAPSNNSVITVVENLTSSVNGYAAENGSVIIYENTKGITNWHTYRSPCEIVDVAKINKVQLYNNIDNTNLDSLDYFDPLNGKLLGAVKENIDYISSNDPAGYNSDVSHASGKNTWGQDHVGKLWYDTSTSKYLDYHQDDLSYNSSYWGYLFPGSIVSVYTWISSSVDPSMYKGPGTVYNTNLYAVSYSTTSASQLNATYYFWVRNTNTLYGDKTLTDTVLENYISDPQNSGITYFAPLTSNTFALYNSRDNINGLNTNIHIGYSSGNGQSVSHAEYELIRANFADDFLPGFIDNNLGITSPTGLYSVLLDSFAGADEAGEIVPNFRLPAYLQVGINVRPRQSMFINRFNALKNYLTYANNIIIQYPINDYSAPSFLYTTGEYYNTSNYWYNVYWWQTGYDNNTKTAVEVSTYSDLLKLTPTSGLIVGVRQNNKGKREIYIYNNNIWSRIGLQDGTIQFSSALWDYTNNLIGFGNSFFDTTPFGYFPSIETRYIIRALNEQIYVNELLEHRNKSLILIFEYIQSENIAGHNYLPWLNKSSFVDIDYVVRSLIQTPNYRPDNDILISGYVDEIKPYHSVVRNIEYKYTVQDNTETYSTDFDLPPLYNKTSGKFTSPNLVYNVKQLGTGNYLASDPIWQNTNYSDWINNYGLSLVDSPNYIVCLLKTYASAADSILYVNNARGLPIEGIMKIDNEVIAYNTIDIEHGTISGLTRGLNQTVVVEHFAGASVIMDLPAIVVLDSGRGYIDPPTVTAVIDTTIYPAPIVPAVLKPIMSGDRVVGVTVVNPGKNYPTVPEIVISSSYNVSFTSDQINYAASTIVLPTTYLVTGDLIRSTSDSSTQTTVADGYYYIYVLAQLVGGELVEITLHKSFSDSLAGNGKVQLVPPTNLVTYTFGLTAQAVPQVSNTVVRGLSPKLRFDRTSYEPKIVPWKPSLFYSSPYAGVGSDISQTLGLNYGTVINTIPDSGTVSPSGGTGATFTIYNMLLGGTYDAVIVHSGTGYHVNDVITIAGNLLNGATTANDCRITVTAVKNIYNNGQGMNQDSTSGSGTGALFIITSNGSTYTVTSGYHYGTGYVANDTITFVGTRFGGATPANDLVITVTSANASGAIAQGGFTYAGTPVNTGSITSVSVAGIPITANIGASATGVLLPITNSTTDGNGDIVVSFNYAVSGMTPAQIQGSPIYFYNSNEYYTYDDTLNSGAKLEIYRPRFDPYNLREEYTVKVISSGNIYNDNSVIVIAGTNLGGTSPANDATIFITTGEATGNHPISTVGVTGVSYDAFDIYYAKPVNNTDVQVYVDSTMKIPLKASHYTYTNYVSLSTGTNPVSYAYIPEPIYAGESYIYDESSYVIYNDIAYRCIQSNNDSTFIASKWVKVNQDDVNLNALDRIATYYSPTSNMLPKDIKQLIAGVSYPDNVYYGNSFSPEDSYPIDVVVAGQEFYPTNVNIISLIYDGTHYIGLSENSQHSSVLSSTDGIHYNNNTVSTQPLSVTSITYYDPYQQYLVTTGVAENPIMLSYDLENWVTVGATVNKFGVSHFDETPFDVNQISCPPGVLNSITVAQGYYYAAGETILSSPDGTTWTTVSPSDNSTRMLYCIKNIVTSHFDGFVAVGGETIVTSDAGTSAPATTNASTIIYSTDGVTWTVLTPYITTNTLYTICSSPTTIVVAGDNGCVYTTLNGTTWSTPTITPTVTTKLNSSTYALGKFVIVGDNGTILTSSDGLTFDKVIVNVNYNFNSITFDGTYLYIGADGGNIYRSNNPSTTWLDVSVIGQPSNQIDPLEKLPYVTVKGNDFLFGYGPEELVPGVMTDIVSIRVITTPGSHWDDNDLILQNVGGSYIGYTNFNKAHQLVTVTAQKFSFSNLVVNPAQLSVFLFDSTDGTGTGTRLYQTIDYTINWITKVVTLVNSVDSMKSIVVEVYEIGNGNQYARGTSDNIPLQTNSLTGLSEIHIQHAYIPQDNNPVCYHNGNKLVYETDYFVTYSGGEYNYTIISFANTYDQSIDFISFALLDTSKNHLNLYEIGYSIPETQVFSYTSSSVFNLSSNITVNTPNATNAIVEKNGLRLASSDYTIDTTANTLTISASLSAGDHVAITTFNETKRLFLNTKTSTSLSGSSVTLTMDQPVDSGTYPDVTPYYYTNALVYINGKIISPDLYSFQTGTNTITITPKTSVSSGDVVTVLAMVTGATPNSNTFTIDIDKNSNMSIYRDNDVDGTWLVQDLLLTDDTIYVNDVSRIVDITTTDTNIVQINGEKIRFLLLDPINNALVGLVRGVLGSAVSETHSKYDIVYGRNNKVKLDPMYYTETWESKNINSKGDPLQLSTGSVPNFLNYGHY